MDNLTAEQRKKNMKNIKSKNTKPELLLRKVLWNRGFRYRLYGKDIFGNPDIYLKGKRIAIFIDSDSWHGKLYQEGKSIPQTNQEYWIKKLERNLKRDKVVNNQLLTSNWLVIRVWESTIKKDVKNTADTVMQIMQDNHKGFFSL